VVFGVIVVVVEVSDGWEMLVVRVVSSEDTDMGWSSDVIFFVGGFFPTFFFWCCC